MTHWTRGDGLVIGLSYTQHGVTVTPELQAELPQHDAGSIRMRLQNFQYLATNGQEGLSNYAESTKAAYEALIPAAMFHQAVKIMTEQGMTGQDIAELMHLPAEAFRHVITYRDEQFMAAAQL